MKKIYVLFFSALLSIGSVVETRAQLAAPFMAGSTKAIGAPRPVSKTPYTPSPKTSSSVTESYWDYDALANDMYFGGTIQSPHYTAGYYPMFPDSNVLFEFSNGNFNTFVHMAGKVLDPIAANMQAYTGSAWTNWNAYTVDSMSVEYYYARTTAPDVVDTMIVYLYSDADTMGRISTYYFQNAGGLEMDCGITDTINDTLFWKGMKYKYQTNSPNANPLVVDTFKILLTEADSGARVAVFATDHNGSGVGYYIPGGPSGHRAISSVSFKPGYSYSTGDIITQVGNNFEILYFEMNGDPNQDGSGSFPTYFGTGGANYGIKDWNVSSIARTSERYNLPSNAGWNGNTLPAWAFVQAYPFEEWGIAYKVTSTFNVGVNNIMSESAGTKLFQNQPNPANNTTLIKYDTKTAGNVVLEVRDLMGRLVMNINQGNEAAGMHSASVDVSKLSKGVYSYTLKTNTESLTRSMIVTQ